MSTKTFGQLKNTVKEIRHNLATVNSLMKSVDRVMVIMSWIGSVFRGLSVLGTFAIFGVILHKAVEGYLAQGELSYRIVVMVVAVACGYYLISAVIRGLASLREEMFEDKLDFLLEKKQVEKQISLDLGRLNDPDFIALKDSCEHRGERSVKSLFDAQFKLMSSLVGFVTSISIITFLDPLLILIAFMPVIPQTIKSVVIDRKRREAWEKQHETRRKKQEYGWCISSNKMLTQMKLFRFVEHMKDRYNHFFNVLRETELWFNRFDFKTTLGVRSFEAILLTAALLYLGKGLSSGDLGFAKLFFILGCIRTFGYSLFRLSDVAVDISSSSRDFRYYKDFMEVKPLVDETGSKACHFEKTPTIELRNVYFAYPRQDQSMALRNCSLKICPGEKVAIVGKNGSGKTTIVRLMTKIFLPQEGEVLINGKSTSEILQESWLKNVLYVTQDSGIPEFTIEESLTGSPPDKVDGLRLIRSAKITGANEFIEKLPEGYQTQIGEDWNSGTGFSSGQLQRMKLTAAFYRLLSPEVHIGLFDEPMAHCDTETRGRFYRSLEEVSGKTIVVVAHDPLYLHHFERILVVDNGAVINDIGGHHEINKYRSKLALQLSDDL